MLQFCLLVYFLYPLMTKTFVYLSQVPGIIDTQEIFAE